MSSPAKKRKVTVKRKRAPAKKKTPKKAAKKRAKRKPKKPRPLEAVSAELPKTHILRQQALSDYVTDPEGRDAGYHYGRRDRTYRDHVSLAVFQSWEQDDGWVTKREAYWLEAQRQLLEKTRDNTVEILLRSQRELEEIHSYALEWCDPIRDATTGEVLRYPQMDDRGNPHRFAGKPMLAVKPQSFEKAVAAALALDASIQERRDEILRLAGQGDSTSKVAEDPVTATVNLAPEDLREIAKRVVERRQPELLSAPDLSDEDDDG